MKRMRQVCTFASWKAVCQNLGKAQIIFHLAIPHENLTNKQTNKTATIGSVSFIQSWRTLSQWQSHYKGWKDIGTFKVKKKIQNSLCGVISLFFSAMCMHWGGKDWKKYFRSVFFSFFRSAFFDKFVSLSKIFFFEKDSPHLVN